MPQALLRFRVGPAVSKQSPCYIAWYHARIRADGAVLPCGRCRTSFGNLWEQSFEAIWNDAAIRDFRQRVWSQAGLAQISSECSCTYCCFLPNNVDVHRIFRWFRPLVAQETDRRQTQGHG
ncbi:MAG: SPASM domain-containing protein [Anaerolineae bacterium]